MERVSVLIPVYNVEAYLPKCLDAVLASTYPNLEVVLINDGSTDGSYSLARKYAAANPNIKLYSYPNSGISVTRNRALKHATGEFVLFCDSDDYIDPDMISVMMKEAKKHQLDIVQCSFVMEYGPVQFKRPGCGHHQFSSLDALKHLAKGRYLNNYPWGKLIRRSCFDQVEFPKDVPGFEDTCTLFKTFVNAKRVGTTPQRFYHYVQRRGSLTNRMGLDTVYLMRHAYDYQRSELARLYPGETFDFNMQYYNADMVIIYTLILFAHRKDHPKFEGAQIDWKELPAWPILYAAYKAWLSIALAKLGPSILDSDSNDDQNPLVKTDSIEKELMKSQTVPASGTSSKAEE